jgi:putative nucleotidyltransferase with HDIG domain
MDMAPEKEDFGMEPELAGFAGPRRHGPAVLVASSVLLLATLHSVIGVSTHPTHVFHLILRFLYLFPIVGAALWYGLPGGLLTASAVSLVFVAHILTAWPGQTMENANQFAMIGIYFLFGVVSGVFVRARDRERALRLAGHLRAERAALIEGIAGLITALGFRDDDTRKHCERVSGLAVEIGRRRGLAGERLEALRLAALVHDLGKIGIPDDVLLKPETLTEAERARIERHPEIAAEILRRIHGAREIAEIVLCHHECPDGSGYPRGLTRDRIPPESGILRVADVYSALTESRNYKPRLGYREALETMKEWGETKLDTQSVTALESLIASLPQVVPS